LRALHTCTHLQEFLDNEKKNNVEKEKTLDTSERQAAKLRLEYQDTETARIQFKDEVYTIQFGYSTVCLVIPSLALGLATWDKVTQIGNINIKALMGFESWPTSHKHVHSTESRRFYSPRAHKNGRLE